MQHILIADDNPDITDVLAAYAKKEDLVPVIAADGEEAIRMFRQYNPAVVLLDVMMPKEDGYEVCRKIRAKSDVPVILITARGEDFEKIMGLDIGADDYIVKPFSPSEVMARIRAILRRMTKKENEQTSENVLSIANLEINLEEYTLHIGGTKISLTKKEIETMWTLASNPNKVFTRDNLLDSLWGFDYFGDSRTVDSHIKRLRAKLDMLEHPNWSIKTIWGVGYKFEVDEDVR
ncbi:response regulator transcription factor [Lachnoclostridium phytofermentans]|uniref:Stage 0 sporulation protein A homolog n=1 Tax=Lachnoclostridium phytofermentans (strain ATCC 700394 / DSM 18823 / ISDg) TaxID=357809 RepID=A9KHT5_LACP7|nr:response regulator transcription factor [Lachnoclostridium phytofermentans]ABX43782.1 two component transcriptional regulator, winged helix family [Lachnoclostridium phytofermentans ISDg]